MNRREFALALSAGALWLGPGRVKAQETQLDKQLMPQEVAFSGYEPGTLVVDLKNHYLYLQSTTNEARRYAIGVGRAGLNFNGSAIIGRKAEWPSWTPTQNMIRREPEKYARFAAGVPGGPENPLGARALYLYRDGKDTMYRIHGTNNPASIGKSVSNGCVRMLNDHVTDLYDRVPVGTAVVVLPPNQSANVNVARAGIPVPRKADRRNAATNRPRTLLDLLRQGRRKW